MNSTPVVVDCHSHVFNAEDLPIDGFLKRLSPLPAFLTGVVSLPLDKLTSWVAVGSGEVKQLLDLLSGRETASAPEADFVDDQDVDQLLVQLWPFVPDPVPPGTESPVDLEELLVQHIQQATPEQAAELDAWAAEWVAVSDVPMEEGLIDEVRTRARALRAVAHRYVTALQRICRPRHLIAAELARTYPTVQLYTPALVDFSYTARDRPATSIQEQIALHSLVAKLSVAGRLPGAPGVRMHPMVGFCPYREVDNSELKDWDISSGIDNRYVPYADRATATDADRYSPTLKYDPQRARPLTMPDGSWATSRLHLDGVHRAIDLVRHAVELGGFAGVKLYPPAGFLPIGNVGSFGEVRGQRLDAALRTLYGYCESQQVPILTHASRSNGFEDGYSDFAAPTGWAQVLRDYPNLRLCFGHFGHMQGVGDHSQTPSPGSWVARFVDLIDAYPHVYADVGCSTFPVNARYRTAYLEMLAALLYVDDTTHAKRRRRLMFGTDFWLNSIASEYTAFLDVFRDSIASHFGDEACAEFMGGNALRFLGLRGEDDEVDPTNLNRRRLVDFYGENPAPSWL